MRERRNSCKGRLIITFFIQRWVAYSNAVSFQDRQITRSLIQSVSPAHRFGLCKSAAASRLAANHSHPNSQLGRWLADWPVSGVPSHVPAYL